MRNTENISSTAYPEQNLEQPIQSTEENIEQTCQNDEKTLDYSEAEYLTHCLKALAENCANDEVKLKISEVLTTIHDIDKAKITEQVKSILNQLIDGSPEQALFAGTCAFFIGFAAGIASSSTIAQTSLSEEFKTLLTGLGAISGALGRLQLGIAVNKNGGSNYTRKLLLASLVGLIITAVMSEVSNLKAIDQATDPHTLILAISSFLSGFGISAFAQVSNVINWHQESGYPSAVLGGVAGLAPGLVGLIRVGLLEALGTNYGYTATSALLILGLLSTTSFLTYSKKSSLVDCPFQQLRHKYNLSYQEASALAEMWGQKFFPSDNHHGDWAALAHQLYNPKVSILIINYIFAFGGFLGMTASLNLALASWGYNTKNASLITSLFSLWSSLCRALIASPINFLQKDPLGGSVVNSIGALLVFATALALAIPNQVPDPTLLLPMLAIMATGFGIACAATFKCVSSEVHKENEIPPSVPIITAKTNALISSIGTLGSVIYTIGGGQLAAQNPDNPALGYVQIFYAIGGLAIIGGLPVLIMSLQNKASLHTLHVAVIPNTNTNTNKRNHNSPKLSYFFAKTPANEPDVEYDTKSHATSAIEMKATIIERECEFYNV